MQRRTFRPGFPGRLITTIEGQPAFVPDPLPPALDMNELAVPLGEAMQALGELRGACRRLPNPEILIRPLQRSEALTSSAMEGTFTTADNLILAEAGIEQASDDSTREVQNYLTALNEALRLLRDLPICHRVIKRSHEILLSGLGNARGAQKRPGEYKAEQNWIGGRTIETARFVPPPPAEALAAMDALEAYINRDGLRAPAALIDLALAHYQLEAIHPFADGNGRVGRMLISVMAVKNNLLDMPVLYMSPVLERAKDEYIDLLFAVSSKGEWTPWLNFFFGKVCEAAHDTIAAIDRLLALQDDYRAKARVAMRSASAVTLVDALFEQPVLTISEAQSKLDVTYQAAAKTIAKLVDLKIVEEVAGLYPKTFLAHGIMNAVRPPAADQ